MSSTNERRRDARKCLQSSIKLTHRSW